MYHEDGERCFNVNRVLTSIIKTKRLTRDGIYQRSGLPFRPNKRSVLRSLRRTWSGIIYVAVARLDGMQIDDWNWRIPFGTRRHLTIGAKPRTRQPADVELVVLLPPEPE